LVGTEDIKFPIWEAVEALRLTVNLRQLEFADSLRRHYRNSLKSDPNFSGKYSKQMLDLFGMIGNK
jgi:hypothetical protein